MSDDNDITLNKPAENDSLQEILYEGARKMPAAPVDAEVGFHRTA